MFCGVHHPGISGRVPGRGFSFCWRWKHLNLPNNASPQEDIFRSTVTRHVPGLAAVRPPTLMGLVSRCQGNALSRVLFSFRCFLCTFLLFLVSRPTKLFVNKKDPQVFKQKRCALHTRSVIMNDVIDRQKTTPTMHPAYRSPMCQHIGR